METLTFDEAVAREAERERAYSASFRLKRPFSYVSKGMYAQRLLPYYELFGREQIKVITLDDIVADPQETARVLFEFIGVSNLEIDFDWDKKVNCARQPRDQMRQETYEILSETFRVPNRQLERIINRDLTHWSEGRKT